MSGACPVIVTPGGTPAARRATIDHLAAGGHEVLTDDAAPATAAIRALAATATAARCVVVPAGMTPPASTIEALAAAGQSVALAARRDCLAAPRAVLAALPDYDVRRGAWHDRIAGGIELVDLEPGPRRPALAASVVICTRNRPEGVARAVGAVLAGGLPDGGEIVVVDSASDDPASLATVRALVAAHGSVRLAVAPRPGVSVARQAGAEAARCAIIAYLDDDAVPGAGWLAAILDAFSDPGIAIVGGPIFPAWDGQVPDEQVLPRRFEGYLGILDLGDAERDFRPDESPWGATYAIRASALAAIGGFDPELGIGPDVRIGGEEPNVTERVVRAGLGRVRYLPAAGVYHDTPASRAEPGFLMISGFKSGAEQIRMARQRGELTPAGAMAWAQAAAGQIAPLLPARVIGADEGVARFARAPLSLVDRVTACFALGELAGAMAELGEERVTLPDGRGIHFAARHVLGVVPRPADDPPALRAARKVPDADRVLLAFETLPVPSTCGAYLRCYEMLLALARLGQAPVLLALGDGPDDTVAELEAAGVEVVLAGRAPQPAAVVDTTVRRGFAVALLSFFHVAEPLVGLLRRLAPETRIVVDSVDIVYRRLQRQADVTGLPEDRRAAAETRTRELEVYRRADVVLAITEEEQELLAEDLPGIPVGVVPNVHRLPADVAPLAGRRGALFLGTYWHPPNVDAVHVLGSEVLPRLRALGYDEPVAIAGSRLDEALASDARRYGLEVLGFLESVPEELARRRVSVAPLRFGAGLKGKVGEALGCGLPVVGTPIAAEGYRDPARGMLVCDDWDAFAGAIVRLSDGDRLWQELSAGGRALVAETLGPDRCQRELAELVEYLGARVARAA
jgi:glycosyltransferase involved in cell wall biosynthesis/GT2 family glycosyltransferase